MNKKIKSALAAVAVFAAALLSVAVTSAPAMASGNYALHFDGSTGNISSQVLVFNGPALTKNFTISADVRWDGTLGYEGILSKATSDAHNAQTGYCLCLADGQPTLALKDSNLNNRVFFAPTTLSVNQWHNVKATYDGEFTNIWVDGVLVGTSASWGQNLPVKLSNEPVVIGREFQAASDPDLASRSFHGDLDNVQTFDGVYPAETFPVMNYTFSEGTGMRIVDEGPLGSASWLSDNVTPQWVQGSDPVTLRYLSADGQVINRTVRPYDTINLEDGNLFNRDGYVFQGWQVEGAPSTTSAGSSWTVPLTNTDIAATWVPVDVVQTGVTDDGALAETGVSSSYIVANLLTGATLLMLGAVVLVLRRRATK